MKRHTHGVTYTGSDIGNMHAKETPRRGDIITEDGRRAHEGACT